MVKFWEPSQVEKTEELRTRVGRRDPAEWGGGCPLHSSPQACPEQSQKCIEDHGGGVQLCTGRTSKLSEGLPFHRRPPFPAGQASGGRKCSDSRRAPAQVLPHPIFLLPSLVRCRKHEVGDGLGARISCLTENIGVKGALLSYKWRTQAQEGQGLPEVTQANDTQE